MAEERLHKLLARAGVASRRRAEMLIRAGRIKVNGRLVARPGVKIDPARDVVEIDGKPVYLKRLLEKRRVYLAFYKPVGVVTTLYDPQGRPKVSDFLRAVPERVYPVGRLDYESEGLLLLTNDGELANRLIHPRYKVLKIYHVWVAGAVGEKAVRQLREGVLLEDGPTQPAEVTVLRRLPRRTLLQITLREGRKRQIRRMCATVGYPVLRLKRVGIGRLRLEGLRPGAYRYLSEDEVAALREAVGLGPGSETRSKVKE
ncbi:pseudouridine synthase [Thermodesulfitimonas sp.]